MLFLGASAGWEVLAVVSCLTAIHKLTACGFSPPSSHSLWFGVCDLQMDLHTSFPLYWRAKHLVVPRG